VTGMTAVTVCAAILETGCVIAASAMPSRRGWALAVAVTAGLKSALEAVTGHWVLAPADAAVAAAWLWIWLNRRGGRRKRSLRQLGHKARARLAALARNMPKPGPVLRPAPQGA